MAKLASGGREKIHENAIKQMLGVVDSDEDDDDNEEEEDGSSSDGDNGYEYVENMKYHSCLPTHDDPEARASEKEVKI